jgi:hypothetical protein
MNWKVVIGSGRGLILRTAAAVKWGGIGKNNEKHQS